MRTRFQGALAPIQKRSDHHLRKSCTTNISAFSLYNILSLPAHPAKAEGSTQLGNHREEHGDDFPQKNQKTKGVGGTMGWLLHVTLSGGAGSVPHSQGIDFHTKANQKEKGAEWAGGAVQFVAFPFCMSSAAHKTGQSRENTPASREDLSRLPPQKGFTDGVLQKPPHWLPHRCQKISAYLLRWPFEREQGASHWETGFLKVEFSLYPSPSEKNRVLFLKGNRFFGFGQR